MIFRILSFFFFWIFYTMNLKNSYSIFSEQFNVFLGYNMLKIISKSCTQFFNCTFAYIYIYIYFFVGPYKAIIFQNSNYRYGYDSIQSENTKSNCSLQTIMLLITKNIILAIGIHLFKKKFQLIFER